MRKQSYLKRFRPRYLQGMSGGEARWHERSRLHATFLCGTGSRQSRPEKLVRSKGLDQSTSALVAKAPGEIELAELQVPDPGPGEVVVQSAYSGISTGTDRWLIQGKFDWGAPPFPIVPGYQKSGHVVAVGEGVEEWMGRPVVATKARHFGGANAGSGSHSQFSTHQIEFVYALAGSPTPELALAVSAQVGYNAAHRIDASRAARVVVIGDGIIGLSGVLSAINRGFEVGIVGRHADRLNIARSAGALPVHSGAEAIRLGVRGRGQA
jgi:bacteriochlorophyllide a dehydrogenase